MNKIEEITQFIEKETGTQPLREGSVHFRGTDLLNSLRAAMSRGSGVSSVMIYKVPPNKRGDIEAKAAAAGYRLLIQQETEMSIAYLTINLIFDNDASDVLKYVHSLDRIVMHKSYKVLVNEGVFSYQGQSLGGLKNLEFIDYKAYPEDYVVTKKAGGGFNEVIKPKELPRGAVDYKYGISTLVNFLIHKEFNIAVGIAFDDINVVGLNSITKSFRKEGSGRPVKSGLPVRITEQGIEEVIETCTGTAEAYTKVEKGARNLLGYYKSFGGKAGLEEEVKRILNEEATIRLVGYAQHESADIRNLALYALKGVKERR